MKDNIEQAIDVLSSNEFSYDDIDYVISLLEVNK